MNDLDKRDHEVRILAAEAPEELFTKPELKSLVQEIAETYCDSYGNINRELFMAEIERL